MKNNKQKTNYILLNCFFMSAILAILVIYLLEINTGVSYGLKIKDNDHRLTTLSIENEHLLERATKLGSMAHIYITSKELNMVKSKTADYLIPVDEALAKR